MKLFKFNENYQAKTNPWEELKVILTDDFDVNINYNMGKIETKNGIERCRAVEDRETIFDSLIVSIFPNNTKFDPNKLIDKIREINTHIELEGDFNFLGISRDLNNKIVKIEDLQRLEDYYVYYLIYQISNKSIRTCQNCIFRVLEDDGYSNYTVNDTTQHCLKNKWVDNFYDPTIGMDCQSFKENKNDRVSIHIEVEDHLNDLARDYMNDCLSGSMDSDLVKAFQEYTQFNAHDWNDNNRNNI